MNQRQDIYTNKEKLHFTLKQWYFREHVLYKIFSLDCHGKVTETRHLQEQRNHSSAMTNNSVEMFHIPMKFQIRIISSLIFSACIFSLSEYNIKVACRDWVWVWRDNHSCGEEPSRYIYLL